MKIYIMADIEGISTYHNLNQRPDLYPQIRSEMALDINACVEGCFQAGATEVIVKDCHAGGYNVTRAQIDPRVDLIDGDTPRRRFADIEGSDGLILLGYHAMAGTLHAVAAHTMSGGEIQHYWINDRLAGEIAIDAAIAAEYAVPVIMVSGCDKTCAEALDWLPQTVVCEVKKSFSRTGIRMPDSAAMRTLITNKSAEAVKKCKSIPKLEVRYPVRWRCEVTSRTAIPQNLSYRWIDARTYELNALSVERALFFNW